MGWIIQWIPAGDLALNYGFYWDTIDRIKKCMTLFEC